MKVTKNNNGFKSLLFFWRYKLKIRLGYVGGSMNLEDCSPSKTVTVSTLDNLSDYSGKIKKLKKTAAENLDNTLRILRYNKVNLIEVYRLTSKLFPLATYPGIEYTNYVDELSNKLLEIGNFVKENKIRVSMHPDHFVLLNSISKKVYEDSLKELAYQDDILNRMGLDSKYKFVLHVGGIYTSKEESIKRFYIGFKELPESIKNRVILENDDKSYNASDVINICQKTNIPFVFDVHHHNCNSCKESIEDILRFAFKSWENEYFPTKFHISSPKSVRQIRNHADFIDENEFMLFIEQAKKFNKDFDIMVEAKKRDEAVKKLLEVVKL